MLKVQMKPEREKKDRGRGWRFNEGRKLKKKKLNDEAQRMRSKKVTRLKFQECIFR